MAVNRAQLVDQVAEKSGATKADVNRILDGMFEVFETSVAAGEKITIPGWLAVERTDRAARTGRNPQTGESIEIAAGHSVKLTAGSKLKAAIAK
ncbi:histone family protein DNA-binding protein (plasmid) [Pseudarthrobacter chlorophenolicus A6]|uniref:Histone family protein DNA-binding protein n=1 Tax=Pseudarthrobacter chlorophenolicus (strain ATCC 700700 / DSM 12829 / CIP 107037 / JCM 12360 / KCTC 9906 / NCIMB 13794 / A6) TaxID=452863 RepID=B8HJ26_PSECP|nr:HU family DNA-binding protein [Pseudarthrobacter chlorophenolicus]ACL42423.1 histone family protein DNA-binding protein [Pseudarthrobacter chlorophenolicus A6]SDQ17919.1 DNA-binding protein HU-beta [Pseudarthrobacter chlorophenolicus]